MKVMVAGGTGLVGSAISKGFEASGFDVTRVSRKNLDLLNREATIEFVTENKFGLVVDAAAKVGGIGANNSEPVEFFLNNINIQNNLMEACHIARVSKFIFMGSSCIYPRNCPQPIKEEYLMTGKLEKTNSAYAMAKIAGIELINSFRKEYGYSWISVMPTNLYGPNDNFELNGSHVLPALIRKFVEAAESDTKVTLWGDGEPLREFLHVDDLATAIRILFEKYDSEIQINVGSGSEISIRDLSKLIAELCGYQGEIIWDTSKPNGTPRKILDNSLIRDLGWEPTISLRDGIESTIEWYKEANAAGVIRK